MRKEPEKYVKGGGLNPFWIDYEIERYSKENSDDYCDTITNTDNSSICDFVDMSSDYSINYYDDISYEDKLEADFQFLKRHSDSEEDLKLAKQILGIDTDD